MFFWKAHGAGNDFVLIDDRSSLFPDEDPLLIERLCNRHKGIGADGLILLQSSSLADYKYRIFNSDGKEASMCGNGLRCLVPFLEVLACTKESYQIQTHKGIRKVGRIGKNIFASLGVPFFIQKNTFAFGKLDKIAEVWDTGVPHAVFWVDDVSAVDVDSIGRNVRHSPLVAPNGVNVNFASFEASGSVRIRTYERGVEKETLSCGTGAAAVAACYFAQNKIDSLKIVTSLNDVLEVRKEGDELYLLGPAELCFHGQIEI